MNGVESRLYFFAVSLPRRFFKVGETLMSNSKKKYLYRGICVTYSHEGIPNWELIGYFLGRDVLGKALFVFLPSPKHPSGTPFGDDSCLLAGALKKKLLLQDLTPLIIKLARKGGYVRVGGVRA